MSQHEQIDQNDPYEFSIHVDILGIFIYGIIKKYNPNSRKFPTHKKKLYF